MSQFSTSTEDTPLFHYIHLSRYSRWRDDLGRRENWEETAHRYLSFIKNQALKNNYQMPDDEYDLLYSAIHGLAVMPSMRAVMTAGEALSNHNAAGFNCAYVAVDSPRAFDEAVYLLMCGTGVGFSVESKYVDQLPTIPDNFVPSSVPIVVGDSKIGWAVAYKELIESLYNGILREWDLSQVRPKGVRLKTFGGRASGPDPLDKLFTFTKDVFVNAAGRRLRTLECHDIMCKIASVVVSGGVRRSALLSLSDLEDNLMRHAKSDNWYNTNAHRALANISANYSNDGTPDLCTFLEEWSALYRSKSGERGIVNISKQHVSKTGRRDANHDFGTNPCGEIILRPAQMCNLSEVVLRPDDTKETIKAKIKLATILGTIQSTLTDFTYLRPIWKKNCEEERLLGVSLTGIWDHTVMSGREGADVLTQWLNEFREYAIEVNEEYSSLLGISPSTAITTVKPSGTVSQLVNCSSGIHPVYSNYYMRRVQSDLSDPLASMLIDQKVPYEPHYENPETTAVFVFPVKAGSKSVPRDMVSAIEQLELYKIYRTNWTEHNPSITVYVREYEWLTVADWVYTNFKDIGGISFLPYDDHVYKQAPYTEVDVETYLEAKEAFPEVDWSILEKYETEANTVITTEFACSAGACEIL